MAKLATTFLLFLLGVTLINVSTEETGHFVSVDAPMPDDPVKTVHQKIPPQVPGRERRAATCGSQTKLHPTQAMEVALAHNRCRSRETATNMQKMIWNDEMAAVSQAWADMCKWEHGMLYECDGARIGQNLFVEASSRGYPAANWTGIVESWASERKDFNFATGQCASGKVCGHYTQVVAAETIEVGCGFAECPTINVAGNVWKYAILAVCDYYVPGNQQGKEVFNAGTPCSKCDMEMTGAGYKCNNNLCEVCYPNVDSTCKCGKALMCEHGGVWSNATCTCQCAKGYYGVGCEHTCTCDDLEPDACGQWVDYCHIETYSDYMSENCKKTCQFPCSLPPSCY